MGGAAKVRQGRRGIIAWGAYDSSKPRVRQLLDALRARGALRAEIAIPVWDEVRDKSVERGSALFRRFARLMLGYPRALARLWRQPRGQAVLLAYPAIPDIFFAWPVARLRGHRLVADAFISFYDTLVADRGMLRAGSVAARLVWHIERLALRLADLILVDTDGHGDYFAAHYGLPRSRFQTVLVGAEAAFWDARDLPAPRPSAGRPTVLFYGQLIPLHGVDTILEAVRLTAADEFDWLLIGSGQEEEKLRRFLADGQGNVRWLEWLDYARLPGTIRSANVALGIFGTSGKAARVIPNKAFQILAAGRPLVTRDSPAIAPLAAAYPGAIRTVPAGDARALADAVRAALNEAGSFQPLDPSARAKLGPDSGVDALLGRL